MKLLLDMYRSAPKEQRDKVQLMAAEKKTKSEVISAAQCGRFVNMNLFGPLRRFWLDFYVFCYMAGWKQVVMCFGLPYKCPGFRQRSCGRG